MPSNTASVGAPKLGLLIIGRKRPGFDMDWGKQIEAESLDTLNALGLGAVTKARAVDDESLREALANLRADERSEDESRANRRSVADFRRRADQTRQSRPRRLARAGLRQHARRSCAA